jgi:hypothetical protein
MPNTKVSNHELLRLLSSPDIFVKERYLVNSYALVLYWSYWREFVLKTICSIS